MTIKKDGPTSPGNPLRDPAAPKRPHATIDVKATEISVDKPTSGPADPPPASGTPVSSATTPSVTVSGSPDPKPPEASPAAVRVGDGAKATVSTAGVAATQGSPRPQGATKDAPRPSQGSSGWSAISHLVAGLAGGAAALVGGLAAGPEVSQYLGVSSGPSALIESTSHLEQRLTALEGKSPSAGVPPEVADKLAGAEARLAKLDEIAAALASLQNTDQDLRSENVKLADQLTRIAPASDHGPRIATLEEQLRSLAAAADAGPNSGPIPQLASIVSKVAALESAIETKLGDVRKSAEAIVQEQLGRVAATSAAAASDASRLSTEITSLRSDSSRLTQLIETAASDTARSAQAIATLQQEAAALKSEFGALGSRLEMGLQASAKTADLTSAVAPIVARLGTVEDNLSALTANENVRKQNLERIVVSLELAGLKRAIDNGQPYSDELARVRNVSGDTLKLDALARYSGERVPSLADLQSEFRTVANSVIDASSEPDDGTVIDRLMAGARSVVRVRKIDHGADDTGPEASVARMDVALKAGQLGDVLAEAGRLPPKASTAVRSWLDKVTARHAIDEAIAGIEGQLKAALAPEQQGGNATPKP